MSAAQEIRVNTLIIGAGRSGTTTLCSYLKAHRDVCFSYIKEVPFFSLAAHHQKGEKYYHSFFRGCHGTSVTASADTYLLMDHDAISRIHAYNPDMKIIVMLRDPVARAYSSYHYSVNFGHHPAYASFLDSIDMEREIHKESDIVKRNNVGHFYGSQYYKHLTRWSAVFPREQLLLLKTSDLEGDPEKFSAELFSFLNLQGYGGGIERSNSAAVPKNRYLEKLIMDRNSLPRRLIRNLTPRPLKHLIMRSGIVEGMRQANRKSDLYQPLPEKERESAMRFFSSDLQLLKKEYGVGF
jgi:hypothetical protein